MKLKPKKRILYLKGYVHTDIKMDYFIFMFLLKYNQIYHTYVASDSGDYCYCVRGKYRSLGDIWNITRYYYPKATVSATKRVLLSFGEALVGHFCGDIQKRIYELSYNRPSWSQLNRGNRDEFDCPITYKKGKCLLFEEYEKSLQE